MHQVNTPPEPALKFAARVEAGFAASSRAAFRRWHQRASAAAITHALSDLRCNPFLFLIESED
jgi:hypothetical protein